MSKCIDCCEQTPDEGYQEICNNCYEKLIVVNEKLNLRILRLKEAATPFVKVKCYIHPDEDDECSLENAGVCSMDEDTLRVKHIRRLAQALKKEK